MIGAAFGIGFIIGPVAGGVLSQWGYAVPAFVAAALSFANLILIYAWLPESLTPEMRAAMPDKRPAVTLDALLAPSHTLAVELAPEARVPASRADLERIVLNLVINAKEAMPLGGTVSVVTRRTESGVLLEVRDQGSGIAPEQADQIFEPYFTTKNGRNTGLGLFAVATIARRTAGVVAFESKQGVGTTVSISWAG